MKTYLSFLFIFFFYTATAQNITLPGSKPSGTINQVDENGKPNGMWWQNAVICPEGEHGCHEWGNYDHGRKIGKWYKVSGDNELLAVENFKNNALDGEAKYYDRGHLYCIGTYRGMNPDNQYDTIVVTDPETGAEKLTQVPTDKGSLRHGMWRYYDEETGRLIKEEEYQVDNLLYVKEYPISKADSTYYAKRNANLPHVKNKNYTPPPSKTFSLTNFK